MEFRLTYSGPLLAYRDSAKKEKRSAHHVHSIRRKFHRQLCALWHQHPALVEYMEHERRNGLSIIRADGFEWFPMVTKDNGLICALDILLLRPRAPTMLRWDIDNRLKTVCDALRKADSGLELGERLPDGIQTPQDGETPFFVLLEDDHLITHVSVTTDTLLEEVPECSEEHAVRMVITARVRPYRPTIDNSTFN